MMHSKVVRIIIEDQRTSKQMRDKLNQITVTGQDRKVWSTRFWQFTGGEEIEILFSVYLIMSETMHCGVRHGGMHCGLRTWRSRWNRSVASDARFSARNIAINQTTETRLPQKIIFIRVLGDDEASA